MTEELDPPAGRERPDELDPPEGAVVPDELDPPEGAVLPTETWPVDVERLASRLAEARDREQKQLLWWVVGTTPAAVLPVLVALAYDQELLAGLFIALALVIQTLRWFSSRKGVRRLEEEYASALEAMDAARPMEFPSEDDED